MLLSLTNVTLATLQTNGSYFQISQERSRVQETAYRRAKFKLKIGKNYHTAKLMVKEHTY